MGISARGINYQPSTLKVCSRPLSPRVRNALWLYESSLVPTKAAAARAVGLAPATIYTTTSNANALRREIVSIPFRQRVEERIMSIREKIEAHSHRAIERIADMMESGDEQVALRAAIDMADRGNETAKTTKLEVAPTMKSEDVQALAEGLVRAAELRRRFAEVGHTDIERLPGEVS